MYKGKLILGTNVFGWTIDQAISFEVLNAFEESGFDTLDTADVYSRWVPGHVGGESETIIGNWMKEKKNRESIIIATKAGADFGTGPDLSEGNILRSAEASLKRLQTDYIDLYQSHFDDGITPPDETLEAYTRLIAAGKVKAIGTSNMSADRIRSSMKASKAFSLAAYKTLQPLYNLYDREKFEKEYLPVVEEFDLDVIPYYGLASGFLTGKYRTAADAAKSPRGGRAIQYLDEKGMKILAALDQVSEELNATPGQVAIAWLIAQPRITAAITSATSVNQWKESAAAINLSLSPSQLSLLTNAGH